MNENEKQLIEKEKQKVEALKILDKLNEDIFKVNTLLDDLDYEMNKLKEKINK
ncbi:MULTISPECIES: hypothetical protein [Helcococcus]|uniref:Uncharacterized protein n=1 Tax=Helcococcus bovis TaxID=3153252 RepID=A0ABW9F5L4_9FIRM